MTARHQLYILFAVSGFAGLIYESIWSHYLKLILGHAAYAQTLVLSLFMGGMALGAWLCGRMSEHIERPLLWYAGVELILGTFALAFDPLFRLISRLFLDQLVPALDTPLLVDITKWSISGLLILPPCILLGATFPLISAAVFRIDPRLAGRTLGWLYFTNSIGAVVGVLASGLFLVRVLGLPGTLLTAGLLNFALATCVWLIDKRQTSYLPQQRSSNFSDVATPTLLLAVTFGSSAASFCYEIGWIRMLSLVLGSATHSFELMLAAFILGLAVGALIIRNYIDSLRRPLLLLAGVQVGMGVLALSTLATYEQSFEWMAGVMRALAPTDTGYQWYLLSSAAISIAVMLPATICAGMTLPLITACLLHSGHGESSIGRVYAANTLGAIVGVLLAVHVFMPMLGVRQVIAIGGVVDVAIGLWLWRRAGATTRATRAALGGALACGLIFLLWKPFDQSLLSSGVFRHGTADGGDRQMQYYRDGKTATVHVYSDEEGQLMISTNGKIDAALHADRASADDYTMILTAALPLSMRPQSEEIAVIGLGSGRSTHTFLQSPVVRKVETIEIESAIVEGARSFGPLVDAAYSDPRSRIHIDDAKTFFARNNDQYDIIVSEPSNPWISGVANLFTKEFYGEIKRYLKDGGLFVQWLQTYESDISLVASVIGALQSEFADYAIYASNGFDLIIVAAADGTVPPPGSEVFRMPALSHLLGFVEVGSADALRMRYVGGPQTVGKWLAAYAVPANSDYFPFVDQHAAQARFRRENIRDLHAIQPYAYRMAGEPLAEQALADSSGVQAIARATAGKRAARAIAWLAGQLPEPDPTGPDVATLELVVRLLSIRQHCQGPDVEGVWLPAFQRFLEMHALHLGPADAVMMATALRENACMEPLREYIGTWLKFMEALARRDHAEVRTVGGGLIRVELADGHALTGGLAYPVLMADLLVAGHSTMLARAMELSAHLPRGPVLDFLLAQGTIGSTWTAEP